MILLCCAGVFKHSWIFILSILIVDLRRFTLNVWNFLGTLRNDDLLCRGRIFQDRLRYGNSFFWIRLRYNSFNIALILLFKHKKAFWFCLLILHSRSDGIWCGSILYLCMPYDAYAWFSKCIWAVESIYNDVLTGSIQAIVIRRDFLWQQPIILTSLYHLLLTITI